jgi:hypothetical protein
MRLAEGPHQRGDEGLGGGRDRRDAQHARVDLGGLARRPAAGLEQSDDVGRVGANSRPAAVARTERPARSNSGVPTSSASAAIAADTDGWVTTSSSAAAVTEPPRITARKLRSWVRVIDISR